MKKVLPGLVIVFLVALTQAQFMAPDTQTPAFHESPPAKGEKLPAILTEKQLTDMDMTMAAQKAGYKAAALKPALMYQLPCYCYCDRAHGHTSLHSCFEGTHGANCGTCVAEALYAYKMSKKGWNTKQIRDGIIRGEFKQINLQNPDPVE